MAENLWLLAAVAVVVFMVQRSGLVLIFMALFFVVFAASRAIAPVLVIAAAALLFPEAASFAGLPDLLLLALIGSAVSTFIVDWLGLEIQAPRIPLRVHSHKRRLLEGETSRMKTSRTLLKIAVAREPPLPFPLSCWAGSFRPCPFPSGLSSP